MPRDLAPAAATVAWQGPAGTLWRSDAVELLAGIPSGSAELVVTDPPYAVDKGPWDGVGGLEISVAWCGLGLGEVARIRTPTGSAYVCGFSEILAEIKAKSARRFAACRWLVWAYRNKANLGSDWGRSHESVLHLGAGTRTKLNVDAVRIPYNAHTTKYPERIQAVSSQYGRGVRRDTWQPHPLGAKPRDVFDIPVLCNGTEEKTAHSTQKPEALIEKLILASSNSGELVVDPFVGSGTTAAVAARLGRRFLVGDADPGYVGIARERIMTAVATATSSDRRPGAARRARPVVAAPRGKKSRTGSA